MRRDPIRVGRHAALWIALAACVVVTLPVFGQTSERKAPPAAKDRATSEQATKDDKPGATVKSERPRAAEPDARERKRGDERIRLDAPVSFPVDI